MATGTAGNPFLYAGYFFDAATGLYYLRARYYDPANNTDRTGRRIDAFGGTTRPTAVQQVSANKAASAAKKKRQQRVKDDDVRRLTVKDPSARVVLNADFAAAARSTVYGVCRWTSVNRPDHMGSGMWSALGSAKKRYGKDGPPRVSFAEVSVKERWASKPILYDHGQVDLSATAYAQYLVQVEGMDASEAYNLAWDVCDSHDLSALGHGAVELRDSQGGMSDSERASASRAFSSVWDEEWRRDGERLNVEAGTAAVASLLLTTLAAATTFRAAQALGTPAAVPLGVAAGLLTVGSLVSTAWYVNTTQTRTRRGFLSSDDPRNGDLGGGLTGGSVCSDAAGLAIGLAGMSTGAWWSTALGGIMSVPGWGCDFTSAAYELFNY
ncbi:MAG: hypothetical protein JXE06_06025 [Coriobacteriia bacterium]|nr:hypothetical protein [Coriobacteriia bacterium]